MEKLLPNFKVTLKRLALLLFVLIFTVVLIFIIRPQPNFENNKSRADSLAKAYEELEEQNSFKRLEIGKPVELYDGTRFTVHNVQIFEPRTLSRSLDSKYVAIALDIEIDIDKNSLKVYNPTTKSIEVQTDKKFIDNYFYPGGIVRSDGVSPTNPRSMWWVIDALKKELILSTYGTRHKVSSFYKRLALRDEEKAQPDIFKLWREEDSKASREEGTYRPRKVRGWITFILQKDYEEDEVDNSFAEGLFVLYKNSSGNIEDLLEQLGKPVK